MVQRESPSPLHRDARLSTSINSDAKTALVDNEYIIRAAFEESARRGFESLFRLYYAPLCSHALRFVYRQDVAEDIVSEVFYQFWKTGSYTQIQHTYRAYLYAAVRHRAYNHLRDELTGSQTPVALDALELASADESPQALIEYDETFQRIEKIIHELPPQCQRVFLMSRFENRKNQEIADELGLTLKTVEAHLSRALLPLRRLFLTPLLFFFIG
ncbi:MAG: RNA polymerase sigma-70 factor [Spirosoma sp.]|nr:RNA polymerase sigma-70 factor [Spirosoma sp.]